MPTSSRPGLRRANGSVLVAVAIISGTVLLLGGGTPFASPPAAAPCAPAQPTALPG